MNFMNYMKFVSLAKYAKFVRSGKPAGSVIAARDLAVNWLSGSEKIVLHIGCFAYSLLSLLLIV